MKIDVAALVASVLFSLVGMAAFGYAKKQGRWKTAVLAVLLMGYPYFVSQTWLLYVIGVALTGALFVFTD